MNQTRILKIIEVERKAQAIYEEALREAEMLPHQAENDAQAIVEQARREAEDEVRRMLANARSGSEGQQILVQAEAKNRSLEEKAAVNFDRAVSFIVARVTGEA
jgi:vacuolar-type H+-ATPase subunit H